MTMMAESLWGIQAVGAGYLAGQQVVLEASRFVSSIAQGSCMDTGTC